MRTNNVILGFMGVVVLAMGIVLLQERAANARMRGQIADLYRITLAARPESTGVSSGHSAPADPAVEELLAGDRAERERLRDEIVQLRNQVRDLADSADPGAVGTQTLKQILTGELQYAGKATPDAAARSVIWAVTSGELAPLADALVLDPAAREKAAEILARLPESSPVRSSTPEQLMAMYLVRQAGEQSMQVLGVGMNDDGALVTLGLQKKDGTTSSQKVTFRPTDDGWRLVVPVNAVEKAAGILLKKP